MKFRVIGYNVFMRRITPVFFLALAVAASVPALRAQSPETSSVDAFVVPESLGKIEERFVGTSSRWVIYIQDVHAHLTAQENIAAIIDHLNYVYGINKVGVEGGWSSSSWPKTWALPSSREKQNFAHALMEESYIGGPAYAAMFSKTPVTLVGLEQEALYEQNRQIYLKSFAAAEEVAQKVKSEESKLLEAKKSAFNPDLWNFDVTVAQFREGKNVEKIIPAILTWADERSADIADLGQIALFRQISDLSKAVQKPKLEAEAKRLMKEFKREGLTFEELVMSAKIPEDKIIHYPETLKMRESLTLQAKLSHRKFFAEIDEAIRRIKEKLFASEAESQADADYDRFQTAKQIVTLKATPADLKAFETFQGEIAAKISAAGLEEALAVALEFYRIARQRDDIFYRQITGDERLAGDLVIVTGGFHTEGLSAKLEEAGISYLVITPELGKELPKEELYAERLREEIAPAEAAPAQVAQKTGTELDDRPAKISIRKKKPARAVAEKETLSPDRNRQTDLNNDTRVVEIIRVYPKDIRHGLEAFAGKASTDPAMRRETRRTAAVQAKQVDGDFSALPYEQQRELAEKFLKWQTGQASIAVVLKATVLAEMTEAKSDSENDVRSAQLAKTNLANLLENRANRLYVLRDDETAYQKIAELTAGKNFHPVEAGKGLEETVGKTRQRNPRIAAIDPDYKAPEGVLVLPPSPASFFLVRPLLEHQEFWKLINNAGALKAFEKVLADIFSEQNLLKSA